MVERWMEGGRGMLDESGSVYVNRHQGPETADARLCHEGNDGVRSMDVVQWK